MSEQKTQISPEAALNEYVWLAEVYRQRNLFLANQVLEKDAALVRAQAAMQEMQADVDALTSPADEVEPE